MRLRGSLAHAEVDFGAGAVAVPLRVRAVQQRDLVEDVAVQHRHRSAVVHLLHGVQQERRGNAFEGEGHAIDAGAADRELAAEVIAGGHRRQRLDGSERIVGQRAAQLQQLAARRASRSAATAGSRRVIGRRARTSTLSV